MMVVILLCQMRKNLIIFLKKKLNICQKYHLFFLNKDLKNLIITRGNKSLIHFNNKKKESFLK